MVLPTTGIGTGPCLINQNCQKDQHYPLERNERMGCTVDSVGSAG